MAVIFLFIKNMEVQYLFQTSFFLIVSEAPELAEEFLLTSYGRSNECAKFLKNGRRTIL